LTKKKNPTKRRKKHHITGTHNTLWESRSGGKKPVSPEKASGETARKRSLGNDGGESPGKNRAETEPPV